MGNPAKRQGDHPLTTRARAHCFPSNPRQDKRGDHRVLETLKDKTNKRDWSENEKTRKRGGRGRNHGETAFLCILEGSVWERKSITKGKVE